MAKLDDLIAHVSDQKLRAQLEEAAAELRRRKKFGLVFEQHIPETTMFPSATVEQGSVVMIRTEPSNKTRYVVDSVMKTNASISAGDEAWTIPIADLLVVKPFGEPVYPVLERFGEAVVRHPDKPFHTVINGENFHALQLLLFGYEGQVDCIYIDPPYNTGARDWKYNNDYVDDGDSWQHSKWLSMMEKRLRLAKRLLKPDTGVLVVTIDEHEVHNLGALLAEPYLFGACRRPMITIVNNAAGNTQGGFYRVEEYAIFCFPPGVRPDEIADDLLSDESKRPRGLWSTHIRSGGINDLPSKRPNLVYPVAIDVATGRIVTCGESLDTRLANGTLSVERRADLDDWLPDPTEQLNELPVLWPYSRNGKMGTWRNEASTLLDLASKGYIRVRENPNAPGENTWSLSYITEGHRAKIEAGEIPVLGRDERDGSLLLGDMRRPVIPKTVWRRRLHDATNWGSPILRALVGNTSFTYPKSPYAVLDTLSTIVTKRPDAVVLDFFAGSGTTLHALCMLNARDGGRRRAILVTNNEVSEADEKRLSAHGVYPGDDEWEGLGICRHVTWPRCVAAITGVQPSGAPIVGDYDDGTPMAEGFLENATFFDLLYADPDAIDVGSQFDDIVPALWMAAGCRGNPADLEHNESWLLSSSSRFAVLLDEDRFRSFRGELGKHPEITHVWLVTDSETAFARMRDGMPGSQTVGMLYRDYLRNFRVNVETNAAAGAM